MTSPAQQRLARAAGRCELRCDLLTRRLYATDASIYQIEPAGVAFPKTADEAAAAIKAAAEAGMPVTPRGAGTGLAGGALGSGLIVDFARYNQRISEFDRDARTVRVGAGVVLDELNTFLRPYGLWFGPDVATSSRATLGGMIANDSSGARAPIYGSTADHLVSLEAVLADGTVAEVGVDCNGLPTQRAAADGLVRTYAEALAEADGRPRLIKRRPGYDFSRYRRQPGDLAALISGSEGTLAGIFSATLKLLPLPARRGLGVVFFASVADALQATVELLDLKPAAIEHVDRILFDQTRGQLAFAAARSLLRLDEEPAAAFLIVEFLDQDVDERLAVLERRRLGLRTLILADDARQALVWGLRKAGLALLVGRPGSAKPVSGIEDAAVRPEQLPEYVAGLRAVFDSLEVQASFYGHAASGLLHVRPVLDLHTAEGVRKLRCIADEVSALVKQFGGSLAGEHGVGIARTQYLAEHLGPDLMAAHVELKTAFDPDGLMNPGKIIARLSAPSRSRLCPEELDPFCVDTNLRQGSGRVIALPFEPVLGFVDKDHSFVGNLEQCNGVGVCLKRTPSMCPTFIATGEEIMSTRGRANTIRAVLERRVGGNGAGLLSKELEAALGPCLSCKACKSECPSNVDMAQLKAELLYQRHKRAGVPLVDRLIAAADLLGRMGCAAAPISNWVMHSRPVRWVIEKTLGIDRRRRLPAYAGKRFDKWFTTPRPQGATSRGKVVLWDDTWVRYHEPHVGVAAVAVLERAGFEVVLARGRKCCGRPAMSRGLLDVAARMGRHNVALLEREYVGLPVIFLEPSCLAMFVDDYRQLKIPGAEELAGRCVSFEQFVDRLLESEPEAICWARNGELSVAIHAHCHVRALTDAGVLPRLARRVPDAKAELLDTGCCGMAGAFGMMRDKYELSVAVAGPLVEKVGALPAETDVVASGTSCRHQIADLTGRRALHMAEWLATNLFSCRLFSAHHDPVGEMPVQHKARSAK